MGVSVQDARYSCRAGHLQDVPAAIRFLSREPLLGLLDELRLDGIHWVIAGGESGANGRPVDPDWVRCIRDQCLNEGVAFFFKQWGGRTPKANGRQLDGALDDEQPGGAVA
jgi:protein gp37